MWCMSMHVKPPSIAESEPYLMSPVLPLLLAGKLAAVMYRPSGSDVFNAACVECMQDHRLIEYYLCVRQCSGI